VLIGGSWRRVSPGSKCFSLAKETDKPHRKNVTQLPLNDKDMDQEITALFQEWLIAFEKTQSATGDEEIDAALALSRNESRIATTPAEGLPGLVVKLGLQSFLNEHADAASELAASAYADLIRLTGHDPASEILAKLRSSGRH
jgi:hypothetical protein